MNSKGISGKFRQLYTKCSNEVEVWQATQEEAISLFRTANNVILRLPALEEAGNYGDLLSIPNFKHDLLSKQMHSLEGVLSDLHDCVAECQKVSVRVGKLAADATRQLRAEKLSKAAQNASLGAAPSLAQCVDGLQTISGMLKDEAALKAAILSNVTYNSPAKDLEALFQLFSAEPNIDPPAVRDTLQRVLALDPL